jgi:hypothetical protein
MATKEDTNVFDYSDLGKDVTFKYKDKTFTIPAIPKSKAKELMRLSRDVIRKSKEYEKNQELNPDSQDDSDIDTLYDFQANFILKAVTGVTREEIEDWPTRLVSKVIQLINETVSDTTDTEKKA